MKRRYFVVVVWLIAAACGAAAQGQTRYLLRPTSPGVLNSVAQKFQLTPVEAVDGGGNVWVVTASSSRPPAQVEKEVDGDTAEVTDFELDQATTSPEVSQSTAAILDSLPAPGSTSYYGTNVLDFYTAQPAATLIRLADTQTTFGAVGSGIVAIIDTGIDPNHPVLANVIVAGYDFTRNQTGIPNELNDIDQNTASALQSGGNELGKTNVASLNQSTTAILDGNQASAINPANLPAAFGHGTMVAGIVHLVAPTAKIMPLKAFTADGNASTYDIIRAIYYATDNGASVINMSFSLVDPSSEFVRAVNYASEHGVVCVSSTGNNGKETMVYPASMVNVLGVASTDNSDQRSTFSNYGSSLAHLAAPGEAIVTTYPGNNYAGAWGTSFSAPFVTGTAALFEQFQPGLNIHNAADAISHAKALTLSLGYGRLDIAQAVAEVAP